MQTALKPAPDLLRELNVWHATAIVVGTIIGSGIFLVPAEMMQAVGSARLVYLAWIVGGLLSFFGALTYAELGALRPWAGGEYVYIRDAYGPLPSFLYAWTWFLIAKPASIASVTSGLVRVLGNFSAFSFLPHPIFSLPGASGQQITYGHLLAVAATILITALNYVGVRKAGNFQLVMTTLKIVMIGVIIAAGFSATTGSWSNFGTTFLGAKGGMAGFMAALVAALWAYDGWNDLNMVSGEIRNPERSIPLALIAGVAIVAVLYIGVNGAVQYVMPAAAVATSPVPASAATQIAIGHLGALLVSAGMALSMFVTLNGTIMSGGRIPFAVARDGYFFKALADVHPRFHTPALALIVQAVMAIALQLGGGSFRDFLELAIFSEWLFYMIAASSIFVFRHREPNAPRPYRTWGYPVVPALFVVAAAVLLYYTFM
ncbi:MAG TPA: amino acid permease, partial [Candidatus Angelobacter sp.]|nr:amino acid permease [Candidatus Angelobacter sp.]